VEIHGVVAAFQDISDMKRLEKMRCDFVASASQERHKPVTIIKGYAKTFFVL
jgi:two-component system phosphate regulon sensor histidine kinase PhoR